MFSVSRKPVQTSAVHPALLLTQWDPFRMMETLLRNDSSGPEAQSRQAVASYTPHFDVKDTKDGFLFKADLPGVKEDDVEVSLNGNRLTVSGKREADEKQEGENTYLLERISGTFSRVFTLPDSADTDKIKASMKDGVLTLVLPKRTEAQPRRVPIGKA